jgi:coenzyme Q-binding protein COQ10
MKSFVATKIVDIPADIAYRVAADVGAYNAFLPLLERSTVRGARIRDGNIERFRAELIVAVGKLGLRESFVSDVVTDAEARTVSARSVEGPLRALNVKWLIEETGADESKVSITLDYTFQNPLLQFAAGKVLELATPKIMKAFEDRARSLMQGS